MRVVSPVIALAFAASAVSAWAQGKPSATVAKQAIHKYEHNRTWYRLVKPKSVDISNLRVGTDLVDHNGKYFPVRADITWYCPDGTTKNEQQLQYELRDDGFGKFIAHYDRPKGPWLDRIGCFERPALRNNIAPVVETPEMTKAFRGMVATGIELAAAAKTAVSESFAGNGKLPADNAAAGLPPDTQIAGKYVEKLTVANGIVTVTYSVTGVGGNLPINGKTVVLVPQEFVSGSFTWDCSGGTMPRKYLPAECQPEVNAVESLGLE